MRRLLLIALASVFASACGVQHIKTFKPRERNYKPGRYETAPKSVSEGSLWQEGSRSLVADFRASRVGDLVSVRRLQLADQRITIGPSRLALHADDVRCVAPAHR